MYKPCIPACKENDLPNCIGDIILMVSLARQIASYSWETNKLQYSYCCNKTLWYSMSSQENERITCVNTIQHSCFKKDTFIEHPRRVTCLPVCTNECLSSFTLKQRQRIPTWLASQTYNMINMTRWYMDTSLLRHTRGRPLRLTLSTANNRVTDANLSSTGAGNGTFSRQTSQ